MANITSLGFNINSKWDGSGVRAARNDLRDLTQDMRRISGAALEIHVNADTAHAREEIRSLAEEARSIGIRFNIVEDSYAAAEARIAELVRDRTVNIHVDTRDSIGALRLLADSFDRSSHSAARSAAQIIVTRRMWVTAIAGMIGAIALLPPALSLVGGAISMGLVGAMAAAAIAIAGYNADIYNSWIHLKKDATDIFKDAGSILINEFATALDMVHDRLWAAQDLFKRAFASIESYIIPVTDALLDFTHSALRGAVRNLEGSAPVVQGFTDGLRALGGSLERSFGNLVAGAEGFGFTWRVTFQEVGLWLERTSQAMSDMAMSGGILWQGMLQGLNGFWDGLMDGMTKFSEMTAGPFAEGWKTFGESMGAAFRIALPGFAEFATALNDLLVPVMRELTGPISETWASLWRGFGDTIRALTPVLTAVADGLGKILEWINPMVQGVGAAAAAWGTLNFVMNMNPIVRLVTIVVGLTSAIVHLATETRFFQDLWAKIAPDSMLNFFKGGEDGASGFSRTVQSVKDTWNDFTAALGRGLDNLKQLFAPIFEEFKTGAGEGLRNAFEDIKKAVGGLTESLAPLWNELKPIASFVAGVVVAAFTMFANILANVVKPAIQLIGDVLAALVQAIQGVIEWITGVFRTVKGVFEMFIGFFQFLIGFFTGNSEMTQKAGELMKKGFMDMLHGIVQAFKGVWTVVQATWDAIVGVVRGAGAMLWGVVSGIVEGIVDFFKWLFNVLVGHSIIPDLINNIVNWFLGLPGKLWGMLTSFVEGVIGFFVSMAQRVIDTLVGWGQTLWNAFQTAINPLQAAWSAAWSAIQAAAQAIWNGIQAAWDFFLNYVRAAWDAWSGMIRGAWDALWNGIKAVAQAIWNGIQAAWDFFINYVRSAYDAWSNALRGAWDAFWNGIKAVAEAIWNGIKAAWDFFVNGIRTIYETFANFIQNAWNTLWNAVKTAAETVWNAISSAWTTFTSAIQNALQTAIDWIRTKWGEIWDWVSKKASDVWEGIKAAFNDFKTKVEETIQTIVDRVRDIWNNITGIFEAPVEGVKKIWNGVAGVFGLDPIPEKAQGGPINRADGGGVHGPGSGTSDSIPAWLSNGEHVWTAKEVAAAGGHDAVESLRAEALAGKFAEGGAVEWMWARVQEMNQGMQLTSSYRSTNDYHGQGKAIDVSNGSDSTPQMRTVASNIAGTWGAKTLELIHSPFTQNIKDGRSVGDGMGFYGTGTMAEHRNHVHWAVPGPLDGRPGAPTPGGFGTGGGGGPSAEQIEKHRQAVEAIKREVNRVNAETANKKWGMTIHEMNRAANQDFIGPVSATELLPNARNKFGVFAPAGDFHGAGFHDVGAGAIAKLDAKMAELQAAAAAVSMGGYGAGYQFYIDEIKAAAKERQLERRAAKIGIATALVESNLKMYANSNVPESLKFPHDAVGSDHDSVGLFQQRQAGWGTLEQRMNPRASAGMFFNALMNLGNWRGMEDGAAAQAVQRSAYPGRYSQRMGEAEGLIGAYAGGTRNAAKGWSIVGENGPEAVRFNGGEQVHTFNEIITELKNAANSEANQLGTKLSGEIETTVKKLVDELKSGNKDMQTVFQGEIKRLIESMHQDAVASAQRLQVGLEDAIERVLKEAGINVELPLQLPSGASPEQYANSIVQQVIPQLEQMIRQQVGKK